MRKQILALLLCLTLLVTLLPGTALAAKKKNAVGRLKDFGFTLPGRNVTVIAAIRLVLQMIEPMALP